MKDLQTVLDALILLGRAANLSHDATSVASEAIAIVKQMMQEEPVGYVCAWHDLDYIGCVISGTPSNDYVPIYAAPKGAV